MPCSFSEAQDQVIGVFSTAWATLSPVPPVHYPDRVPDEPFPPKSGTWARVTMQDTEGDRVSLGRTARYRTDGVLIIQLFAPGGTGRQTTRALAELVLAAFRGKRTAGGVWFHRERAQDVGADGHWWQTNVVIEYQYDTIQ